MKRQYIQQSKQLVVNCSSCSIFRLEKRVKHLNVSTGRVEIFINHLR